MCVREKEGQKEIEKEGEVGSRRRGERKINKDSERFRRAENEQEV